MRMLHALLAGILLLVPGCRGPGPPPPVLARLVVRFLDRDAVLELAAAPPPGPWRLMNAGLWDPLEVRWKPGTPAWGAAAVGRRAPGWVLLEDPAGEVHRVVLAGPDPEDLEARNSRLEPEEREALAFLGLLWVLGWGRR